ncbi:SDR family oxidoreductase [Mycolicibacterium goodii]|uniref:SDR family oxidoreductase n=1 Tax=Mycolicibacterium goodii TaxID=134601 RepID=A0ABS6HUE1_MYCGD|nr:SDR family oxidoreductase [Mycolicibacterium goodii]MBU8826302.1 SDR family oxidoreductase [Mycolicibacterium goodii]MBU8839675.1 SDR family oxidoreductase [Mycolicibacterium goodii]
MELHFTASDTVLITGGSRGIGAATAQAFAAEGVGRIHLVGRDKDSLEQLRASIDADVTCHALDLSSPADRAELTETLADVDILINNAGAIPQGSLEAADLAAWQRAWELKLWGYLDLSQKALTKMRTRESGVIVNVVGLSGERPDAGYLAGSMANAALMTFTRAVGAYSLDHGVRVVAVNPGPVHTQRLRDALQARARTELGDPIRWPEFVEHYPGQRMATAQEVADTITFLASRRSSYTSGTVVTLDGGMAWRGRAL